MGDKGKKDKTKREKQKKSQDRATEKRNAEAAAQGNEKALGSPRRAQP